eukprot:gene9210-biopygen8886
MASARCRFHRCAGGGSRKRRRSGGGGGEDQRRREQLRAAFVRRRASGGGADSPAREGQGEGKRGPREPSRSCHAGHGPVGARRSEPLNRPRRRPRGGAGVNCDPRQRSPPAPLGGQVP